MSPEAPLKRYIVEYFNSTRERLLEVHCQAPDAFCAAVATSSYEPEVREWFECTVNEIGGGSQEIVVQRKNITDERARLGMDRVIVDRIIR
jgi:hypothetical protein